MFRQDLRNTGRIQNYNPCRGKDIAGRREVNAVGHFENQEKGWKCRFSSQQAIQLAVDR